MTDRIITRRISNRFDEITDLRELSVGDYIVVISTLGNFFGVYLHSVVNRNVITADTIDSFVRNELRLFPSFSIIGIARIAIRRELPYDFQVRLVGREAAVRQQPVRHYPRRGRLAVPVDYDSEFKKKVKKRLRERNKR